MGALAAPFAVSLNAISKHLRVLEEAGLVRREIRGREHHVHLDAAPLRSAAAWAANYREFWETRLDALERFLEDPPPPTSVRAAKRTRRTR